MIWPTTSERRQPQDPPTSGDDYWRPAWWTDGSHRVWRRRAAPVVVAAAGGGGDGAPTRGYQATTLEPRNIRPPDPSGFHHHRPQAAGISRSSSRSKVARRVDIVSHWNVFCSGIASDAARRPCAPAAAGGSSQQPAATARIDESMLQGSNRPPGAYALLRDHVGGPPPPLRRSCKADVEVIRQRPLEPTENSSSRPTR